MSHPFDALTPDLVLDAVESLGYRSDARVLALNSYENRVYQIGLEDRPPLVAKFYRPDRWSDAVIREEHAFTRELAGYEVPVVAPLACRQDTLFQHAGFRFALFPRCSGQPLQPDNPEQLFRLGQLLGRLHAVAASQSFRERDTLEPARSGQAALDTLLDSGLMPKALRQPYSQLASELLRQITRAFQQTPCTFIRLHGDCHPGNILCQEDHLWLVDFDDCQSGPAIQDLWMLLAGSRQERQLQLAELLEGYQESADFDTSQLRLIEPLRALRLLTYSAWLARRQDDPAFPRSFPWFGSECYWQEQLRGLEEQRAALGGPPLSLY